MVAFTVRKNTICAALAFGIALPFPRSELAAQTLGSLSGIVASGVNDEPLEGVTVKVIGSDSETMTDEAGRFLLVNVPIGDVALRAELVGYASVVEQVTLTSDGMGLLRIQITPVMATLSELLVVAGTGDPQTIGSSDVEVHRDDDSATAADLLAARFPGVDVDSNPGAAGDGSRIRIRGSSSLSLSNGPAIYVDGIRITPRQGAPAERSWSGLHVLDLIPASMVERIRVLKGPAAAAYPDAAHGVILIETRTLTGNRKREEAGTERVAGPCLQARRFPPRTTSTPLRKNPA